MPFFSIVVPVYNTEEYIIECLESILKQTFCDWEAILVDDQSTDNSLLICKKYETIDSRFKVITKKKSGPFDSRLVGINNAKGKYYIEVNSDDYIAFNCLERIYNVLNDHDCDVVAWNIRCFGESDSLISMNIESEKKYQIEDFINEIIIHTNHSLCNKAIPIQYFNNNSYETLPKDLYLADDYALGVPAICWANGVYVIDDELYYYRRVGKGISYLTDLKMMYDAIVASEFVVNAIKKANIESELILENEACTLLYAIWGKIWGAILDNNFNYEMAKKIHENKYYVNIEKYESIKTINWFHLLILKLFRNKLYVGLNLLANVKRIFNE